MPPSQDNSEDFPSGDDYGPSLRPGCVYRTPNLLNSLKIGRDALDSWKQLGLKPLLVSGKGTRSDYYLSDEVIAFLRKQRGDRNV